MHPHISILHLYVIIKKKGPVGVGKAVATVDGEVALTAELTFMVG